MKALLDGVRDGRARAIARLITRVENDVSAAETAVKFLYPHTGRAHIIGITGPPGSGKSTLVTALAKWLRRQEWRVAVVAVDPSSPFTGGALLGDRVRMQELAADKGVFIRSMASRGALGGLAKATWAVIQVLDAAGFDKILVETVGAGQAEVDIAGAAHTTLVIEAPGMGDDVQAFKAGILEIADILVVNKADRPGADGVVRALELMLHLGPAGGTRLYGRAGRSLPAADNGQGAGWQIPVLATVAAAETGVPALGEHIEAHRAHLQSTGEWLQREQDRCRREIQQLLQARFAAYWQAAVAPAAQASLVMDVAQRRLDPYTAVDTLFTKIIDEKNL